MVAGADAEDVEPARYRHRLGVQRFAAHGSGLEIAIAEVDMQELGAYRPFAADRLLAAGTAALIVLFGGDTHALVPLFAVGVFLAFTLSQAGMVTHWWRERSKGWWAKATLNGIGALATAATLLVIGISKFAGGAWITIVLIPAPVSHGSSTRNPSSFYLATNWCMRFFLSITRRFHRSCPAHLMSHTLWTRQCPNAGSQCASLRGFASA